MGTGESFETSWEGQFLKLMGIFFFLGGSVLPVASASVS